MKLYDKLQPEVSDARCVIHPIDFARFESYPCTLVIPATDPRSYVRRLSASVALPASLFAFVSKFRATVQVRLISLEIDSNSIALTYRMRI